MKIKQAISRYKYKSGPDKWYVATEPEYIADVKKDARVEVQDGVVEWDVPDPKHDLKAIAAEAKALAEHLNALAF